MTKKNTNWAGTSSKLTLVALAVLAAPLAWAQIPGPYIGVSGGETRATIDNKNITAGLAGQGFTTTGIANSDKDSGYKIFGGYQFGRYFAVEGGYFDLGKFGYTATTVPAGTMNGTIKVRGLNLDLVGILPISDSFSLSARVGTNYAEANDTFSGTGAVNMPLNPTNTNTREANLKLGLGAQWDFTPSWGVRGELERYRINDGVGSHGDIDMASIGLIYRFGKPARVQVAAAPAPAYVAPPPPPPPVVMAPPPPAPPKPVYVAPAPRRVSLASDSLFDFDKSDIKSIGADAIDKFARDLNGVSYDMIVVTGHSDRIGSSAYNQKLSERRANAVRNYLIDKSGIPASKITAQGVGETAPVTKTEDCKGTAKTKALIQCLQPDRRVDLEVTGSK